MQQVIDQPHMEIGVIAGKFNPIALEYLIVGEINPKEKSSGKTDTD
jgi:hypothetical protein